MYRFRINGVTEVVELNRKGRVEERIRVMYGVYCMLTDVQDAQLRSSESE